MVAGESLAGVARGHVHVGLLIRSYFIFHISYFIFHISYFIFHISYFIFHIHNNNKSQWRMHDRMRGFVPVIDRREGGENQEEWRVLFLRRGRGENEKEKNTHTHTYTHTHITTLMVENK